MTHRQAFVNEIRQRILETEAFSIVDSEFSLQAPPLCENEFKAQLDIWITAALLVFSQYRAATEGRCSLVMNSDGETRSPEQLLETVKNLIEIEVVKTLRRPFDGLFDRREAVAEVVDALERTAPILCEPRQRGSFPTQLLDDKEMAEFEGWVGAAVDAVLAVEADRMNFGITETWPTRPTGAGERGTD